MSIIAGKVSNAIGNKDSTLILRGTSIKVQWGNKFIDLIKNGKINSESEKILKTVQSVDDIKSDGIYLLDKSIWVNIGETKVELSNSSTTYVSFLTEQKDTTIEQKEQALTNIGFYYETLEEAKNSGIQAGIIFVKGDSKLYVAKNGTFEEYITQIKNTEIKQEENPITTLIIKNNSLLVNGIEYITCDNELITAHKEIVLQNGLSSWGATSNKGFKLYEDKGKSILEIDQVIERLVSNEEEIFDEPIYSKHNNYILSGSTEYTLRDKNKYEVGQKIFVISKNSYTTEYDYQLNILTITLYKPENYDVTMSVIDIEENVTEINIPAQSLSAQVNCNPSWKIFEEPILSKTIEEFTITAIKGQVITLNTSKILSGPTYLSSSPYIKIQDNTLGLYENHEIGSFLGEINEDSIEELNKCEDIKQSNVGIYSNNFIGLNSKLYDTTFKYRCDYPKYDSSITIPDNDCTDNQYNQVVPNVEWVKKLLELAIPIGTIVMWNGNNIPENWAICNGLNGTPNLTGKFIKASNSAGNTGGQNNVKLSVSNLPDHTHSVAAFTSNESGKHSHTLSGQQITTSEVDNHNHTVKDDITTDKNGSNTHTHSINTNNLAISQPVITSVGSSIATAVVIDEKVVPSSGAKTSTLAAWDNYLNISTSELTPTVPVQNISMSSVTEEDHTHTISLDITTSNAGKHSHTVTTADSTTSEVQAHTHTIPEHSTSGVSGASNAEFSIEPEYYSLIFIMKIK